MRTVLFLVIPALVLSCGSGGGATDPGIDPAGPDTAAPDVVADPGIDVTPDRGPATDIPPDLADPGGSPDAAIDPGSPSDGSGEVPIPSGCCLTDSDCGEGDWICVDGGDLGVCKHRVGPSTDACWRHEDCGPSGKCFDVAICGCEVQCDSEDHPGVCRSKTCCMSDDDCAGKRCHGAGPGNPGVCVEKPVAGRCWIDADCGPQQKCKGAAWCPCDALCEEGWYGPGACVPEGTTCVAVQPSQIEETCDAANLVVFDGVNCVETCLGCCGCGPWCQFTFPDLSDCAATCLGAKCAVWDGGCDDAIPAQPWWAYDGHACIEIDSCVCDNCPGTYKTEGLCKAACAGVYLYLGVSTTGGKSGNGAFDWEVSPGKLTGYNPLAEPKNCNVPLGPNAMNTLWEAAAKVDFPSIQKSYKSPENPTCCCDQIVSSASGSFDPGAGGGGTFWTEWCSESETAGKMPKPLLDLFATLETVGKQACGW